MWQMADPPPDGQIPQTGILDPLKIDLATIPEDSKLKGGLLASCRIHCSELYAHRVDDKEGDRFFVQSAFPMELAL